MRVSLHYYTQILNYFLQLFNDPVVRIGFQSAQYTVSEASTIATIIGIEASGAPLEREIIVSFSTSDSTATGTY